MAEGEKLEREGFGMPGTPEEELNKELFPVTPPISSKKVIEFPGRQAAQQPPRPAQDNKRSAESMTSADRLREANQKGAALQKQWESARGAEGGDDAVDIGKAA
jgi:hypothetical protein